MSRGFWGRVAGLALYGADEQTLEDFAGFVAVADVFEGFGGVLAADVEHYFFTTAEKVLVEGSMGGLEEGGLRGRVLCADGGLIERCVFVSFLVIPHDRQSGVLGGVLSGLNQV